MEIVDQVPAILCLPFDMIWGVPWGEESEEEGDCEVGRQQRSIGDLVSYEWDDTSFVRSLEGEAGDIDVWLWALAVKLSAVCEEPLSAWA